MKILVTMPLTQRQREKLEKNFRQEFVYYPEDEVTEEIVSDVEVILGNVSPEVLPKAKELRWLQLSNAGTEGYCDGKLPEGVTLTNATGAFGLSMAEHMIGMLFELKKGLHRFYANQQRHEWKKHYDAQLIQGKKVLVVGMGDIGTAFAQKMHALGCRVIGVKRREGRPPEGVEGLYTLERLDKLLPQADIVAMCLPGNKDTYHLMNKERLSLMKEGAVLLNVGRGITLDTEGLMEVLRSGHLAGAALDVTDPEPLPKDHPLWDMENVVLTPHISGASVLPEIQEKILDICIGNLECYLVQRPMRNVVDFKTGYCQ